MMRPRDLDPLTICHCCNNPLMAAQALPRCDGQRGWKKTYVFGFSFPVIVQLVRGYCSDLPAAVMTHQVTPTRVEVANPLVNAEGCTRTNTIDGLH